MAPPLIGALDRPVEAQGASQRVRRPVPGSLQVLASALRAGHSFNGALGVVVQTHAHEPARSELRTGRAGRPARRAPGGRHPQARPTAWPTATSSRSRSSPSSSAPSGGNSAEILDTVVETIRERAEIRRLVRTLTAQGRMARWILTGAADLPDRVPLARPPGRSMAHVLLERRRPGRAAHRRRDGRGRLARHPAHRRHRGLGATHDPLPAHRSRRSIAASCALRAAVVLARAGRASARRSTRSAVVRLPPSRRRRSSAPHDLRSTVERARDGDGRACACAGSAAASASARSAQAAQRRRAVPDLGRVVRRLPRCSEPPLSDRARRLQLALDGQLGPARSSLGVLVALRSAGSARRTSSSAARARGSSRSTARCPSSSTCS